MSVRNYILQTVASQKIKEEKVPLFSIHSHTQSNKAGDQASSVELLDDLCNERPFQTFLLC